MVICHCSCQSCGFNPCFVQVFGDIPCFPFATLGSISNCCVIGQGTSISHASGAMVQWLKVPAWTVGDRGFETHPGLQRSKKQNVSLIKMQYYGEPLRGNVLGLRPLRLEFPNLCLECSVISFISLWRFSWPSLAYRWPKTYF